jgi:hypothetical protein
MIDLARSGLLHSASPLSNSSITSYHTSPSTCFLVWGCLFGLVRAAVVPVCIEGVQRASMDGGLRILPNVRISFMSRKEDNESAKNTVLPRILFVIGCCVVWGPTGIPTSEY